MDISKETVILATGHTDTKMIDEVYSHLTGKDNAKKLTEAIKEKGTGIFQLDSKAESKEESIEDKMNRYYEQKERDKELDKQNKERNERIKQYKRDRITDILNEYKGYIEDVIGIKNDDMISLFVALLLTDMPADDAKRNIEGEIDITHHLKLNGKYVNDEKEFIEKAIGIEDTNMIYGFVKLLTGKN
jgi:hypothetical protein